MESHPLEGRTVEEMLEAWVVAFESFCNDLKGQGWYDRYLASGEPTRTENMRRLLSHLGVEDIALAQRMSAYYDAERLRRLELFPEALGVLQALQPRYPMGMITNGPSDIQWDEVRALGLEPYFRHILVEGDLGVGKPYPQVFQAAEQLLGCRPEQMLMVGNSYKHDILGAIQAGWRTAWVQKPTDVSPSNRSGKPESKPEGMPEPDFTVVDLRELLPILSVQ